MATGIYKITNNVNGKIYIGQSKNIAQRWQVHKQKARMTPDKRGASTYLANAMRKYGIENFSYEVIEQCRIAAIDERERYWISYYNSTNPQIGYNQLAGGEDRNVAQKLNKEQVHEIYDLLLNSNLTMKAIGAIYGVSEDSITYINQGTRWTEDDRDYPIRKGRINPKKVDRNSLIETLKEKGFNDTALYYEVSLNTIKHWCRSYDIPNPQKKFNAWIDNI